MQITPETPLADFKFKGHTVKVPQPYKEGHALTANEAKFVNRSLASVTGNIFASAVNRALAKLTEANAKADKEAQAMPEGPEKVAALAKVLRYPDDHEDAELRGKLWVYSQEDLSADQASTMYNKIVEEFEPGVTAARGEGIARDPIESIADNIAWERIKVRLGKAKIKVSSVTKQKKEELIDQLHALDPSIMETAKTVYAGNTKDDGVDKLFAGLATADAPADGGTPASSEGNDSMTDTNTGDSTDTNTVSGGEGTDSVGGADTTSDTVTGGEGQDSVSAPVSPDLTVENVDGVDRVKDGEAPAPGATEAAIEAAAEPNPTADNPGTVEVAPDASAGEQTPPAGAFG